MSHVSFGRVDPILLFLSRISIDSFRQGMFVEQVDRVDELKLPL